MTTDLSNRSRQPKGSPVGGELKAEQYARGEDLVEPITEEIGEKTITPPGGEPFYADVEYDPNTGTWEATGDIRLEGEKFSDPVWKPERGKDPWPRVEAVYPAIAEDEFFQHISYDVSQFDVTIDDWEEGQTLPGGRLRLEDCRFITPEDLQDEEDWVKVATRRYEDASGVNLPEFDAKHSSYHVDGRGGLHVELVWDAK